ncbi:BMP family lipoprotein [Homoserinibacter sp. YIM 151385]|uniref:BMP family lipoprotein n=1 Tax=Homoserinibacter sp. YIM 151385 TaxID=2985506 RepID=UPI0022F095D5|nr:BMP family ABC transporter substrate-binding protein [Homoserinibacter sp. YIM 151385]WBU36821.1 BMP family ABC transporter substrate-binding protein [Homoserinibacter sp. YIM 151385]
MNAITRKRGLAGLALLGAVGVTLAGCAAPPEEGTGAEESDFRACAVSDEGSWNDKSFNEAAYGGLEEAKETLGIQISDAESNDTEDFEPNLQQMIDAGCDVTFAVGFNFSLNDTIFNVADANKESHFVWIDGWNQGQDNLKPITYSMDQSSYLAGYLAAAYSTTKVIGTYGGLDIPAVTTFMDGFYYGAKAYEEESGTAVTVLGRDPEKGTGTFTDPELSFGDTEGAKSISAGQLADGADVIFPVAGGLFSSTAEAIRDSGKDAVFLGVDKDVAVTSPEYADLVLTSVEKRMTQAVLDVITALQDGEDFTVEPYVGTLENDGTALSDFGAYDDKVSDEIKTKLDELKAGIIDGSIELPTATEG